ncbi:DUF3574 domain-containing protein [Methylomagnum ishizawai]|uniref:DUF3574 domain-containing protein n=1 Tax=Methylomagnum ishizawai TaxID=1760988 RepID=UPI001593F141|nr:DUF3574 domain-containing protein [Methylomagnum ishizawai]
MKLGFAALCLAGALAACVPHPPSPCPAGERSMQVDTLYFGTRQPEGVVAAAAWRGFVDAEVTPRFPGGFTWWLGEGQWRTVRGDIQRESTYILRVVHGDTLAESGAVAALAERYKVEFRQEAVLRVRSIACVAF